MKELFELRKERVIVHLIKNIYQDNRINMI